MKFIIKGVVVELIMNFDSNVALVICTKTEKPKNKIVNYAELNKEQFSLSESIICDVNNYSVKSIIENFSLNDLLLRISRKIEKEQDSNP